MARLSVTIDDELLEQARGVLRARSKRETITEALREVLRRARLAEIAGHKGKVDLGFRLEELLERRRRS